MAPKNNMMSMKRIRKIAMATPPIISYKTLYIHACHGRYAFRNIVGNYSSCMV
jgi:hypothetical protein